MIAQVLVSAANFFWWWAYGSTPNLFMAGFCAALALVSAARKEWVF